jgi:UDP-N-acetyl-D-mannosaminuronic acid dehydrogenase
MSDPLARLMADLDGSTAQVGVVGLGYVGLPVACLLASTGLRVTGIDIRHDRVRTISAGRSPIEGREPGLAELLSEVTASGRLRVTTEYTDLAQVDIVLVTVETPVDVDHRPSYQALGDACRSVGTVMREGALVVIESTLAPGTIEGLVRPLLENVSGRRCGYGFFLGHCPERVMPGRLLTNLRTMNRVLGAASDHEGEAMRRLYARYVDAELDVTNPLTAELVKTAENAYRDVNIAFANQVALICEAIGSDVWEVRDLVNKSPGRQMLRPGAGVGGHCVPKDPWLLASALGEQRAPLIEAARVVNESMPKHVAMLTLELLTRSGVPPAEATVAVLGYAYLEDSDDARASPTVPLLASLREAGCTVRIHDPHIGEYEGDLVSVLTGADVAVVMVAHRGYRALDLNVAARVMRHRMLVDGRGLFDPSALINAGFSHRTLGIGAVFGRGALPASSEVASSATS